MTGLDTLSVKGIFIDLDDTLYEYEPCNRAANEKVFSFLSHRLHRPLHHVAQAFERGRKKTKEPLTGADFSLASSHSRLLYFQKTIEHLERRTHAHLTLECERLFWATFQSAMKLMPGAEDFLKKAKQREKIIVVITDMTAQVQLQKILTLGIGDYVDFIVSSEEAGREKPHPAPLKLALEKTHLAPHEVVMIGEDEKRDIASALAASVLPIALRYRPSAPSVLFAEDFAELSRLLNI